MALTVRSLVAQRDLAVRLLAGAEHGDRPITWVHVSELDDPTPFLSGGELLLTTGLFVRPATDFPAYVERLAAAGVLGLGFGIGLSCAEVPADLVAAADRIGLPVLEVPRRTPFIALSRAVSRALAADEYAAVTRTFSAQQELARAALAPDSPARMIRLLARRVDGWVVLLDGRGEVLALGGDAAAAVPAVAVEAARLREHRGSVGVGFEIESATGTGTGTGTGSGTATGPGPGTDSVSLQPIGAGPVRRGFLAVGHAGPLAPADRHLVNAAVMLLTLGLEEPGPSAGSPAGDPRTVASLTAGVRAAAVELALSGRLDLARSVAARAGLTWPADPLAVLVAHPADPAPTPPRADQQPRRGSTHPEWDGWDGSHRRRPRSGDGGRTPAAGGRIDGPRWSADLDGELVLITSAEQAPVVATEAAGGSVGGPDTRVDGQPAGGIGGPAGGAAPGAAGEVVGEVAGEVTGGPSTASTTRRFVGWSVAADEADLPAARDRARAAAVAAADRGLPVLGFDDIGGTGLVALWDAGKAAAFAASLLRPLVEHDRTGRGDLIRSLRAWLAHHGQWDPAASALGVHRHTLRRRMTLAADLLHRDLDSPTVRSELWLALESLPSGPPPPG